MTGHTEVVTKHSLHGENVFLKRTFWVHAFGYMKRDIVAAFQSVYIGVNIMLAVLLGITLFLLEFPLIGKLAFFASCGLLLFLLIAYPILTPVIFGVVVSAFFPEKEMGKFFWPMTLSVIVFIGYTLFLLV